MRIIKLSVFILVCTCFALLNGCAGDLKLQNATQCKHIADLEGKLRTTSLQLDQANRKLETADSRSQAEIDALNQKNAALLDDAAKKRALIEMMNKRLLYGGAPLPVEISTMLEDFAKGNDMITYDASRGIVKFKSDLLFEKGSDIVAPDAIEAVKSLSKILTSEKAKDFDIIVAGHTDDIPIRKPQTRAKHPTNWHLSANRAISVLETLMNNNIASQRLSVRGFGEFRPVEDNEPGKKGNTKNRRVEIYIVAKGV